MASRRTPQGQNVIRKAVQDSKAADDAIMLHEHNKMVSIAQWHDGLEKNSRARVTVRKHKEYYKFSLL
jgi:hypothetical protein